MQKKSKYREKESVGGIDSISNDFVFAIHERRAPRKKKNSKKIHDHTLKGGYEENKIVKFTLWMEK